LEELIAQILVHSDPRKAWRLCPLSGANEVKSDATEVGMGNQECHSCVCFTLALATTCARIQSREGDELLSSLILYILRVFCL